jgi:uncharacterized Zn finger protein
MYTIYLDVANQVSIICPNCGLEQNVDTTKLKDTGKKLKGKCSCGEPYQFNIEFRKRYRKHVSLPGIYTFPGIDHKEDITIKELSLTGIQFESLNSYKITKNDLLEVKFKLDNRLESNIRKLVKVIWVRNHIIGANFIETKLHEEELESYLQM